MAKKTHSNTDELRAEFARKLSAATTGLCKKQVADKLDISRQMLYQYLSEKATPGGEVIQKACAEWKLTLTIKGTPFTGGAFGSDANEREKGREPKQPTLADLLDKVRKDQVEAKIVSCNRGIFTITLQIKEVA